MPKYSGADDIYHELVEASEDNWLLGLVAFAVFEEQRIEWAKHHRETNGRPPTSGEVTAWYESKPSGALMRARADAEAALMNYGEEAVEDFDDAYRKEIAQGIVVAEIQKLGRWWPQIGKNVIGGVVGSMLFTALVIVIGFFVLNEPSANEITTKLRQQGVTTDGQVRSNE